MTVGVAVLRARENVGDEFERNARPFADALGAVPGGVIDYGDFAEPGAERFRSALSRMKEGVFVSLAHGRQDRLFMYRQSVVELGCADVLAGKFCYFVSCHAGVGLGPAAVQAGAVGFVGFDDEIYLFGSCRTVEQRRAFMSGVIAYLGGERSVPSVAAILKSSLAAEADAIERNPVYGHLDMWISGSLRVSSNRVVFGE